MLCSVKFTHQFDTKQEKAQGDYNMMVMVSSSSINPTAVAYFLLLSSLFFYFSNTFSSSPAAAALELARRVMQIQAHIQQHRSREIVRFYLSIDVICCC